MAYQPPGYPPAGGAPMPAFAPPPAGFHAPQAAGAPSSHPPAAAGAPPAFQHLPPQPGARPFMAPPPMGAPAGFQAPPSFQPPLAAAAAGFNPAAAAPPAMNRPPPSFQPPPAFHPPPSAGAPNVPPTGMPPAGGFAPPPGSLPGRPPQFNAPPPFQPPTAGQPPQPAASAPQQPSFAPPPSGFSAPLNPLAAPPAPQQQQLGAGLPGRFAPPPPVAVPPPNLQNLQAHQGQVVFNQVQPVRPFDDGSLSPGPQAPQNGFGGLHGQPSHPQQQQQQPLSAGQAAVAQFQQQQQQMHQPPQQQFQQMQQHQQQQQQQQPPQQQQFQDGGYNPYVQQSQPPQQQQMYNQQQQQPQYGQQPQQQQNGQNGYPNPGVQSPVGYTPGGTVKPKKVDRIDPNQIPRRVDFPSNGGQTIRYHTRSMTLPPAATADFVCVDEGNCSPRFIRLTTNNIAHESDLIDSTRLCIGAIIQPLANLGDGEEPVPVVQYAKGPLRCSKCMAYVNPFFQFVDNGNAFLCNLCGMKNDVPDDYRCNLDANGLRRDRHDRPELCRGSVEFEVGSDFVIRPIQDPVYLFVIDVSYGAVVSGLVNAAIAAVRAAIDQMALLTPNDGGENRLKVGLITYDQSVHYYSLKTGRTEPMMLVMSDVDEPFVPCPPEEICVRVAVEENRTLLHSTLDMLASVYERNKVTENLPVFGAAIQAASETLMSLGGGKILIMQSNLPQCGVGKLEHRDAINLYFTEKEKSLQIPQSAFYSTLATKCAENAITIDLFVCANGYVDLATIGVLCEKTGGAVCVYPGFNNRKDGLALQRDIFHDVTRVTGYDGIMIVRCSTGLKVAEHFGNFYHRKVQEMELASIDCDKTFGVRLEHEGKLKDKSEACIQCALLYTTQSGHRRIRVHTISVPVTSVMSNIFRFADLDAIVNLSLKQAVRQLLDATTCTDAQNALTMACIESLFVYRKFCASATSAGQLILPEPLKLLPLCTLGLIKHPLFQDGLAADERSFLFAFVNSMPCYVSVAFVCPRLFSLSNFPPAALVPDDAGRVFLPAPLTLSSESVNSGGLYLLDDGRYMYLYIGSDLPMPFLEEVFQIKGDGKSTAGQYRIRHVPNQPQHISSRINVLIGTLRKNKPNFQNLQIISRRPPANQPQNGGPSPSPTNRGWETFESLDENLFFSHLIEDAVQKPVDPKVKDKNNANARPPNSMSYVDFLCYIHKKIQAKFL